MDLPPMEVHEDAHPLRYADVAATLALVIALGDTSYAVTSLPRNSVGTAQLKTHAVTKSKLATGLAVAGAAGPAGAAGAPGAAGPKRDPGLQGPQGPAGFVAAFTGLKGSGTGSATKGDGIDVAAVALTPGNYMLYGNVEFHNFHATTREMTCGLGAPAFDAVGGSSTQADAETVALAAGARGFISAMGPMHVGPPTTFYTTATLSCFQSGVVDAGQVDFTDADIVAIPIDQIR